MCNQDRRDSDTLLAAVEKDINRAMRHRILIRFTVGYPENAEAYLDNMLGGMQENKTLLSDAGFHDLKPRERKI